MPEKFIADEPLRLNVWLPQGFSDKTAGASSDERPIVYDPTSKTRRFATQADIEQLLLACVEAKHSDVEGWTPPLVYDVTTDSRRVATQADVDNLQGMANEAAFYRTQLQFMLRNFGAEISWPAHPNRRNS